VIFKRRFGELIDRQLTLFEQDHADLFDRIDDAEDEYRRASRDEAEERFGDLQDVLTEGTDELVRLRDGYAESLESEIADEYVAAFDLAVLRRFPDLALELVEDDEDEG
jgi:hypothetical protein